MGESVYNILGRSTNEGVYLNNVGALREITLDTAKWNYPSNLNVGSIYRVYEYIC